MSKGDTTFIQRHRGKAVATGAATGVLSLPLALYLFATKESFQQHCHECDKRADKCEDGRAENWRECKDREVEIAKLQAEVDMLKARHTTLHVGTNGFAIAAPWR